MKPADVYTGFRTYDLTACVVHALKNDDGSTRIVARYPKEWDAGLPFEVMTVNGPISMRSYLVTAWHEVTLATVPAP